MAEPTPLKARKSVTIQAPATGGSAEAEARKSSDARKASGEARKSSEGRKESEKRKESTEAGKESDSRKSSPGDAKKPSNAKKASATDAKKPSDAKKVSVKAVDDPPQPKAAVRKPVRVETMAKLADMKKVHDEEWEDAHEAEAQAAELIQYLKDKWQVEIDKTSSLIEMAMRTVETTHHKRPENYWLVRRSQEKQAEHTGFFSSVRKPYAALGPPELDVPMLVFRNLPDTLKIDCGEWIETQLARAEAIRKANALLPRMPQQRTSRAVDNKGKLKMGAGGTAVVDKFVRAAELFQRGIRGSMTYTKLLEEWRQSKEDETASRGSAFGVVKRTPVHADTPTSAEEGSSPATTALSNDSKGRDKNRKSSVLDDKLYQLEMLNMEKMIGAMYNIIKSILNIKPRHLRSEERIPHVTVMQLRVHSPETRLRSKKNIPAKLLLKSKKQPGVLSNYSMKDNKKISVLSEDDGEGYTAIMLKKSKSRVDDLNLTIEFGDDEREYRGTGRTVPRPFDPEATAEIYPLSVASSAELMPEALARVHEIINSETYLDDRPFELLTATLQKEPPTAQAIRNTKNDARFRNIFDRKGVIPKPIWHEIKVEKIEGMDNMGAGAGKHHESFSVAEYSLKSRDDLIPHTPKIPDPADILTPTLPGAVSVEQLDSEDQSRVNLLAKIPGAANDEPPPSPILRLLRESGIKTTDKEMFTILMEMKRPFRHAEKKIRQYYTNEVEKYEWDTLKRYKAKVSAIFPDPIYQYSISAMRDFANQAPDEEEESADTEKRPALWYRDLVDKCEGAGAMKHHGCKTMILKLHKYCDVDTRSRPQMLNRLCLLVISLPTNELGTPYFQKALRFLLDKLFGSPKELLFQWLAYRNLPYLA